MVNRHWAGGAGGSLRALLNDVLAILACRAVAMVELELRRGSSSKALKEQPWAGDKKWGCSVLSSRESRKYLRQAARPYDFTGRTFVVGKGRIEVDVICLPLVRNSVWHDSTLHALVLLDAASLKPASNHMAERNCQRALLAQTVVSWWIMASTPKARLRNSGEERSRAAATTLPRWLYAATLPELVSKAIEDAEDVRARMNPVCNDMSFREES